MQYLSVKSCLESGKKALTFGNRLILPFHCRFISITVGLGMSTLSEPDIYHDFSSDDRDLIVEVDDLYTSVYFLTKNNLRKEFGQHKGGVMITYCEQADDIFEVSNHKRIRLKFRDDVPQVSFEQVD
ncbi:MAG: hypothetical protein KDC45_02925 [Bacteroidetes bacterium]|nr:hypothetical protein [Bacteroidota bacterium]